MKISVCIPTYNRLSILQEAISSCLIQSKLPDEILIGDDSTTEETENWIREFKTESKVSIRHFRNRPSLKQVGNVNMLLNRAQGDLLVLLHDDDILMPDALEKLYDCFFRFPEIDAAFGKQYMMSHEGVIDENETSLVNELFYRTAEFEAQKLTPFESGFLQQFPNDAYMLRSAIAREIGYTDNVGDACDFEFSLRLGLANCKMYFLNEYTSKYRISRDANSNKLDNNNPVLSFNMVEKLNVPDKFIPQKNFWLKSCAPIAISNAAHLGLHKKAVELYFSKWHRNKIFSPGGIKRLLIIFYYWLRPPAKEITRQTKNRLNRVPKLSYDFNAS
jgi:glycosyltransferase involved in cell wall biosynthesis